MNILAHLYLSNGINDIMLGNFIGDFVKGNKYLGYPPDMQKGIILHRKIDTFTDKHQAHKASRDRFREQYGLYSGIVVDIIFDHFLAKHWHEFYASTLDIYAKQVYNYIQLHHKTIPQQLQKLTPYMINNNWLVMYESLDGIERVLTGMSKRTSLPSKVPFAMNILNMYYDKFNNNFHQIIADLQKMVEKSLYLSNFAMK